ncbi:PaaI family thioesterase [Streptomyces sp. ISL-99]|uniref:PaaI family thioesterase n=1 Tax=Streptomyces sp. ISL-99 TaxID=2819193 RepID=UPI001BE8F919|nr:PaaI family thioesterase [Streptomyces sp. ISL-99]MBT2526256.1 PaaI family thioesterase [Streptomyces sp. ISL-99]
MTTTGQPHAGHGPYVDHLGLHFEQVGPDRVVACWSARGDLLQPHGILHGGVHCAVVESVASVAADRWLGDKGTVVGVSNTTDFFAPVTVANGRLTSTAEPIHRGATQQVWSVETVDAAGSLVARGQVRLQNLR